MARMGTDKKHPRNPRNPWSKNPAANSTSPSHPGRPLAVERPGSATPRHGREAWNRDAIAGFAASDLLGRVISTTSIWYLVIHRNHPNDKHGRRKKREQNRDTAGVGMSLATTGRRYAGKLKRHDVVGHTWQKDQRREQIIANKIARYVPSRAMQGVVDEQRASEHEQQSQII